MTKVDKVTIRLTEEQANAIDIMVADGLFKNRSEAIRASINNMITSPEPKGVSKVNLELPDTMMMTIEALVQMDHFVSKELGIRELVRNGLQQIDIDNIRSRQDMIAELGENRSARDLMDEEYRNMLKE